MKRKIKRRKNKQIKILIIGSLSILLFLCVGYAAFSTNLSLTAKGNIKDINEEVDSKVPQDGLLFWGESNNPENTLTVLKDKSLNNNDGILNNFNNTIESGYNNNELILDGIDDYINIGLENFNFVNGISYVIYTKITYVKAINNNNNYIIGNWESAGGGILINNNNSLFFELSNGKEYKQIYYKNIDQNKYYIIIGIYDKNAMDLYIDGTFIGTNELDSLATSPVPIYIGANPQPVSQYQWNSKLNFKEAMVYNRALTEQEIKLITEGLQKKYKD